MNRIKSSIKKITPGSMLVRFALIWFIVTFVVYPNLNLFGSIFNKDGRFSLDVFSKIMRSERAVRSLKNSFILAFSMIITVNIVGTLVVLFTEYWQIKGGRILKLGYMTSLVYGGVVLVSGYKFVYGSNGLLTKFLVMIFPSMNQNWFVGYGAVIFIMTFACTSNHILFLTNAIRGLDNHTIEAGKNMGASGSRIFFKIVLPTIKPTMFAITILTFLTGLSAMSAPMIVGGESFQTISPMIITFANTSTSRDIAALLAIILGLATIILLFVLSRIEKGGNYISVSKTKGRIAKQKINNPVMNIAAHILAYLLFAVYMAPICLVILFSFSDSKAIKAATLSWSSLSLENYIKLFTKLNASKPYLVSITYSIIASVIVTIIAIAVSKIVHKSKNKFDKFYEYSVLIPWMLPSTLIALGLMFTYDESRWIIGNKILVGTPVLLLIAYIVMKLPFSFRMIKAAFFSIDSSLEEAAKGMGASTLYTIVRVTIPIVLPAILSVIVMNFNSLLADYDVSVFLYYSFLQPLGIVIKAASDETATINAQAMSLVYSVILMIISSIALYLVQGNGLSRIKSIFSKKNSAFQPIDFESASSAR